MYIRIKLPAQYYKIQGLKKDNFPYRSVFSGFMKAVIHLGMRENLSMFATFGRIEHELAADKPLDLTTTGEMTSLDYREDDDDIIQFYKNSTLTQKQQTLMFVRLMLRLQGVVGNSVPEMIYLIDNIQVNNDINELRDSEAEVKSNQQQSHESVSILPGIRIHKTNVSKPKVSQPVKVASEAKEPIHDKNKVIANTSEVTESKSSVERLVEHAEKLTSMADDVAGEVVKTNPLMADFYDFDN